MLPQCYCAHGLGRAEGSHRGGLGPGRADGSHWGGLGGKKACQAHGFQDHVVIKFSFLIKVVFNN